VGGTAEFVRGGLERGEPVLVAIPCERIAPLREELGDDGAEVRFIDMGALGRNPGRIIPAVRDWVERQDAPYCRFVGEPLWPGRTDCEAAEATRHEALLNVAFAHAPVAILCPYDTSRLPERVLADSERTHPHLVRAGCRWASDRYTDPLRIWDAGAWSLPEPAQPVDAVRITGDLGRLRRVVTARATEAGLSCERASDLAIAANEAATNALIHSGKPDQLRIWNDSAQVICEITDHGRLEDPLAGRTRPAPDWEGGRGLWLINQLCDLVELRPGEDGTTIRLHVDL
jgi:anti-sigma regulatory factor (Ser/Thr protein kinase)